MSNDTAVAAVLETALQVAYAGMLRAREEGDVVSILAYYDVLSAAYSLAATCIEPVPLLPVTAAEIDALMGLLPTPPP